MNNVVGVPLGDNQNLKLLVDADSFGEAVNEQDLCCAGADC